MTTSEIQIWVGIVGSLVTIGVSVLAVLNFQRRRDRSAAVGAGFRDVVDSLASDNATQRMAAAILLRRFFDIHSEQGAARLSYAKEAVAVIAGLLRESKTGPVQKVLADGLRYAPSLAQADLQGCNLTGAYLGQKKGDRTIVNLTNADLFKANLTGASLKGVNAAGAAFVEATLERAVLSGADLTNADFRAAKLDGAKFDGARIAGAQFSGAFGIPADVASRLDAEGRHIELGPAPQ
jgi:Pentapeptide repeats (8 copies)